MLESVDVAVIDLGLPDGFGGDLIRELHDVNPNAKALVLTASLDRPDIARAIETGAAGALDKSAGLGDVANAVRRARTGESLVPADEMLELVRYGVRERDRERDAPPCARAAHAA